MTSQVLLNRHLSLLESKYQVCLDEVQIHALKCLLDFVFGEDRSICLSGKAGCGKTLLLSMLSDILRSSNYIVLNVTPTNKSKINFEHRAKKECVTIHSLLGLRPNLDILEFDASQLSFDFVGKVN